MAKKTRVAIVDDNDLMRTLLRAMLRGEEYDVVGEARNGLQAIEMAERIKPDIICMDILMPEKNGLEAMAEIKLILPQTRFVMISGNPEPENVQEAINNGACGFIIKPFNAARVLDTMEKVTTRLRNGR